ncbi:hypothetical protein DXG03_000288 [Asterophora parasitica]|uniref:Metal homeostatis protein bsd2 n=1 Tax=Asterophora parasitica TaxID=117018 RepID=A0A9P7GEA4_9AGAR|nr:hypothetical protein DXG03_000288 [Asterophora parasitica]
MSWADRDTQHNDMEAAFDYSEDDDDDNNASESHPLNPYPTSPTHTTAPPANPHHVPGTYDFENVDYDYPPPGSPPRPSAIALPNNFGNSNGLIPSVEPSSVPTPRQNWFTRSAAAVLPADVAQRLGLAHQRPVGAIGGGTNNDGVFANVTAKPTRPVTRQEGDETLIVPEDTRADAPPSYASAQADAVPPYWETTVHAPFSPGSVGEIIVDNLPTGSLFSFLWNMLVSISFQFVGFLLTYLLHTTHAARLGSRAGLGVTLIQYGFALRGRMDRAAGGNATEDMWVGWGEVSKPTTTEGVPSAGYYGHHSAAGNATYTPTPEEQANSLMTEATTEWLSFFLMTVGYWRVKRWEHGILASQRNVSEQPAAAPSSLFSRVEQSFSLQGTSRIELLRQGFGLNRNRNRTSEGDAAAVRAEEGTNTAGESARGERGDTGDTEHALETDYMIPE